MREFVKHIAMSLQEDEDWRVGPHWVENERLKVEVWHCNGLTCLKIRLVLDPHGHVKIDDLGLREKFVVWKAVRKLKRRARSQVNDNLLETIIQRRLNVEGTMK